MFLSWSNASFLAFSVTFLMHPKLVCRSMQPLNHAEVVLLGGWQEAHGEPSLQMIRQMRRSAAPWLQLNLLVLALVYIRQEVEEKIQQNQEHSPRANACDAICCRV